MLSRDDLTRLALRALEDALAQAHHGPVQRTWGHKLALAWMAQTGATLPWHCKEFWERMADPYATDNAGYQRYLRTSQPIFAWAGLWSRTDEWGDCYTGVMTDNAPELAHIHDRSPVILDPDQWQTWLTAPLPDLSKFDCPYPAFKMLVENTARPWSAKAANPPQAAFDL